MEILIEGSKLDFTLEKENNVQDVIDSVEKWLVENQKIMGDIKVDGQLIEAANKESLAVKQVSKTKVLEIEAINNEEYAINSLIELKDYISRSIQQLEEIAAADFNNDKKNDVFEGIKWVNDMLFNVCRVLGVDMNTVFSKGLPLTDIISRNVVVLTELETYRHDQKIFKEVAGDKLKKNLLELLDYFPKILSKAVLSLSKPGEFNVDNLLENLNDVIINIKDFQPIIPNIGTNLQTGREIEAFTEMKNLLSMMESLIYHLRKIEELLQLNYSEIEVDGKSVKEVSEQFHELLIQLSGAMQNNDIVLLGDLLEYEVLDRLEIYQRIFAEIIVLIQKKNYN